MSKGRDPGWEALLARYISGDLNADDRVLLNERLRSDAGARRDFAEIMNMDVALAVSSATWTEGRHEQLRRHKIWWWLSATTALGLVLMLAAAWWMGAESAQPFATVTASAGADMNLSGPLRGEMLELHSGVIELLTVKGTRVVVEAPARFRFESAQLLNVELGRVLAVVTPAGKGFTIQTPVGRFVDQGTEFGVEVTQDGSTEMHVYQGQVVAQAKGGSSAQSLHSGQAIHVSGKNGQPSSLVKAETGKFLHAADKSRASSAPMESLTDSGTDSAASGSSDNQGNTAGSRTLFGNLGNRGGLSGTFYDFKQGRDGLPKVYNPESYFPLIKDFAASGFDAGYLEKYFKASREMNLSFLAVPVMEAREGPKAFGVADQVDPTGWMIHYSGTVSPPQSGEWRFAGYFDDALMVYVNGELVFAGSRDDDSWGSGSELRQPFSDVPVLNGKCLVGKWVNLSGPSKIDILVGERPGSQLGGLLLVQHRHTRYRTRADGTPILPLFVVNQPDKEDVGRMRAFAEVNAAFDLEWQDVPVFKIEPTPQR